MTAFSQVSAKRSKVTVIGAGIIGVCSANYLLRQGFDVEVIDSAIPGSEDQCSYGNAGGICPGSCIPNSMPGVIWNVPKWLLDPEGPLYVRLSHLPHAMPWLMRFLAAGRKSRVEEIATAMRNLHRFTFECYEPLMKDAGCEELLQKRGQLFVYENENGPSEGAYGLGLRRQHGVKVEILNAHELSDLEPALAPIYKAGVFLPEQGQCPNPGRLVAALAAHAVKGGAQFTRARVESFEIGPDGPTALNTSTGRIPVEKLVLATGAWSGNLARMLGDKIPFESERGYHVMFKGAETGLKIQTLSTDRKFVASPMEEGLRLTGTVEFAGLKAAPNMRRAEILEAQAKVMFPQLDRGATSKWMGHRPGTPDSIPVIDRATRYRNVIYAFGHGHQGMIAGAVTGKLVAELAADMPTSIDISAYRVNRFGRL